MNRHHPHFRRRITALVGIVAAAVTGFVLLAPPASATSQTTSCQGVGSVYGVLSSGQLTYTEIDPATSTRTKLLLGPNLGFVPKTMATLNFNTILVTSSAGILYRVDISTNRTSLGVSSITQLGGGWTMNKLAYDGTSHLFGTLDDGTLRRYIVTATKPTAASFSGAVNIDSGFVLRTLTTTDSDELLATSNDGRLLAYHVSGVNDWASTVVSPSTWGGMDQLTSPGGGVFYGRNGGGLFSYSGAPTDSSGADLTSHGAVDSSGWTQVLISANPNGVSCLTVGQKIVNAARSQFGYHYCWDAGNANGPTHGGGGYGCEGNTVGYDCTGLTIYAFAQGAGITLSHDGTQGDTIVHDYHAREVSQAAAHPGALIMFHSSSEGWYHAGIYVGGGQMIDSLDYGTVVGYDQVSTGGSEPHFYELPDLQSTT